MSSTTCIILMFLFSRLATAAVSGSAPPTTDVSLGEVGGRPPGSVKEQGGPDLGLVQLDPLARSLRFPVMINQRTGPVEYALVTSQGKTHESVFRTDAEPTHIHLGLLLLGGKPVYTRQLPTLISQPLPGEPVLIEIAWTEGGTDMRRPLETFVVTADTSAPLASGPWVYNGSVMTNTGLLAQDEGSIVSVWLDPGALINNPRAGRGDDALHRANPKALPSDAIPLEMVIRLAKDSSRVGQGEPSTTNRVHTSEQHDAP